LADSKYVQVRTNSASLCPCPYDDDRFEQRNRSTFNEMPADFKKKRVLNTARGCKLRLLVSKTSVLFLAHFMSRFFGFRCQELEIQELKPDTRNLTPL